ncbi:MAG: hypothetical protein ACYST6_18030 [Planctomycetota bacterium]|jgi:hypothetical protein
MVTKLLNELISRYGPWRLVQYGLAALTAGLVVVLVLELLIPVGLSSNPVAVGPDIGAAGVSEIPQPTTRDFQELTKVFRRGLFKASAGLGDKPLADRTIERIRSKLTLKGILLIRGEQVAYVHVEGEGLKRCKIGDSVGDLFTVQNIGKRNVEIAIVGHKVTLTY